MQEGLGDETGDSDAGYGWMPKNRGGGQCPPRAVVPKSSGSSSSSSSSSSSTFVQYGCQLHCSLVGVYNIKTFVRTFTVASVVYWLVCWPLDPKVAGSKPGQGDGFWITEVVPVPHCFVLSPRY
jgi:hypothetical protein